LNVPTYAAYITVRDRYWLGARAVVVGGLLFLEKIFLTQFVDHARADAALGAGEYLRVGQHFGFRFIVALVAALVIFSLARGRAPPLVTNRRLPHVQFRPAFIAAHFALVGCLAWLSSQLFPSTPSPLTLKAVIGLWLVCGAAAGYFAFAALAPLSVWLTSAQSLGKIWLYSVLAAAAAVVEIPLSQQLWSTGTTVTFHLVRLMLSPILPGLTVDPASQVLGTPQFAVQVSYLCSGLEGMGLILAFTLAWLGYCREDYRFPRAFLLIPLGMILMFGLNVVRIALLTLIGSAGYQEVAVYGFHSQAGWIAFNMIAGGIALCTQRAGWWTHSAPLPRQSDNPTAPYVMPLLAILAAGMLSHAFSGRFEWLYPLRLLACLALLAVYRRPLAAIDWRWSWRGPAVGMAVFIVWFAGAHFLGLGGGMPKELAAASPLMRWSWIGCRVAASVLTVPLAEELAYRGFLMRRLATPEFENLPYERVGWLAIAATSVAFGAAHGSMWLPGTVAGLAYGSIVKHRGHLGEGITAHMTTNFLVAAAALGLNDWAGF
jgi:exosortase E/protease (VPEID-CTERM system)